MNKKDIIDWAKKAGYSGDTFEGVDDFAETIGMCLIYDPEKKCYYVEPWEG